MPCASGRHAAVDVAGADWRNCGSCGGGADRRALRKRGEWRCARNSSASVLVLIRAPDLAATERRGGAGPVGGLLGGKDVTAVPSRFAALVDAPAATRPRPEGFWPRGITV